MNNEVRGERIEELINYIFGVRNGKVYLKEGIFKECMTIIKDRLLNRHSIGEEEGYVLSLMMLAVYNSLERSKEVQGLEVYLEEGKSFKMLLKYFYSKVVYAVFVLLNEDKGAKRLRIGGVNEVTVVLDCESLSRVDEGVGLSERVTDENNFLYDSYSEQSNKTNEYFRNNKEKILTKNQLKYYNTLKEDYINGLQNLLGAGYTGKKDYILRKGLSVKGYYTFKENVSKRASHLYEEGKEMESGLKGTLKKILDVLDEIEDEKQVQYLVSKYIQINFSNNEFEEVITKGLSVEETKEVIRMVKTISEVSVVFKNEELEGDESVSYISKRVMYKIVDNIYNKHEELEEQGQRRIKAFRKSYNTADKEVKNAKVLKLTGYGFEPIDSEYR